MTGVTHGADTERLRSIATQLGTSAQRARDVGAMGSGSIAVLLEAWQGADVGHFAGAWDAAGRSLEQAADHLQHAAEELRRQSDEQTGASRAGSGSAAGAGDPAPTAGDPTSPDPKDDGSEDDGKSGSPDEPETVDDMINRIVALFLPPGLDLTDPEVLTLLQSPEGREWLAWLNANDIQVVRGSNASEYAPSEDTIYLADGADEKSLIHEASHAKWDAEGKNISITDSTRDEYINHQIDNEVDAVVAEFEYMDATGEDPATVDDKGYLAYTEAKEAALADGATAEEAEAAGAAEVHERFMNGDYMPGNEDEDMTYMEYYGDAWDKRN